MNINHSVRGRRGRTFARPHCPRMLVGCSLGARHGPFVYKGCHYRLSIMPLIVGRECSLSARWVLVGKVCRAPAPLRRANVRGARPCPLPLALPLPARPVGAERCPAFGPGVFMRGPALPRSPRTPLPLYISVCGCRCSDVRWWWYQSFRFYRGSVGVGVRGPSVSFRPPRFGADAGRPPMCPAPRLRPSSLCACGLGVRPRGHLAGRWPVRFKCPRARTPCPLAIALARFRPTLNYLVTRFCHVSMTIR